MTLSDNQIKNIYNELKILGISDNLLQDELCDHICCSIEAKLSDNISFKEALHKTIVSFGEEGLIGVQKQIKFQFFGKYRPFRNLLISSFIILFIGFFLKLFHLPGAGISYLIATSVYLIGIFRLSYLIIKEKSFPKYHIYFGLILVVYIVIWLMAQKIGGNIYPVTYLVIPIIFFFGLLCSLHFFSKLRTTENNKIKYKYLLFMSLCLVSVLLCLTDILVLLRIIQIDLTRFFFWVIVIEFILSCIYLIFIKHFKNIAVLTLLLSVTLFYWPLSMPALLSKVHINKSKQILFILNTSQKTEKNFYLIDESLYLGFNKIPFQKQNDTTYFLQFEIRDKWQLFYSVSSDERIIKDIMGDEDIRNKRLFVTKDTVININY